jgi:hypothetical protein
MISYQEWNLTTFKQCDFIACGGVALSACGRKNDLAQQRRPR